MQVTANTAVIVFQKTRRSVAFVQL